MHSFHPYVQRRRKRRRIGGRVVERRTDFPGKNVLFTTQVRRGVLRLFGISSVVFPSPPGSAHRHRSWAPKSVPGERGARGQPRGPWAPLGIRFWCRLEQEQILRQKALLLARSLLSGLLYLSEERRLSPLGNDEGVNVGGTGRSEFFFLWKANNAIYNGDGCGQFTSWPASPGGSLRSGWDAGCQPNARS